MKIICTNEEKLELIKSLRRICPDTVYLKCECVSSCNLCWERALKDMLVITDVDKNIKTNADRVRNMTDEMLVDFIVKPCKVIKKDIHHCAFFCDECIEDWLKERVENYEETNKNLLSKMV